MAISQIVAQPKCNKRRLFRFPVILLITALLGAFSLARAQANKEQKPSARQPSAESGKETFLQLCAWCHGRDGKGYGSAAITIKDPLPDLTTLARRHEGRYPTGYVSAVLTFGRSPAVHGSEDMPVWGTRFRTIDPVHDPTGQHHIEDVVAYLNSLQAK